MGLLSMMGLDESPRCDLNPSDPARCTAPIYPRWRNNDVRGDREQAMGYLCTRCQRDFLPEQVAIRLARADEEAQAQARVAAAAAAAKDEAAEEAVEEPAAAE